MNNVEIPLYYIPIKYIYFLINQDQETIPHLKAFLSLHYSSYMEFALLSH